MEKHERRAKKEHILPELARNRKMSNKKSRKIETLRDLLRIE